jgi:hypothetical protein
MDTIKREGDILSDHTVENHSLPELQPDGKITTADLAEAGRSVPTRVQRVDSDLVVEPLPVNTPRTEVRTDATDASSNPVTPVPTRVDAGTRGTAAARAVEQETGPLFSGNEANELRARWDAIQVGFVDEPRAAVEQADALVAGTMKRLAEVFAAERSKLEGQWDQGENVSTEDLRLALRRYRSFFGRLLSI